MIFDYNINEITKIAQSIMNTNPKKIIVFEGAMGMGKTTLIREILNYLQVEDAVQSPTFSIVNEYKNTAGSTFYHFDFYRITDEEEAYNIGVEDYLYSNSYCFIEWAEKIPNLLPENYTKITLSYINETTRNIVITN